ncbi:uncharacterized protein LOC111440173 [Cucurbita moschata]|uniref:Uncharacterized protein LOC111440173 n=1 Tax=Cucurbita moschata TaxID=3662 RepID=A0A6J1EYJ0_CUCMO|nr:uncharacterized protein LOC111440173 [Cucurbita moschata]
MILKSFILGNLVSLCMKIINSVVLVGLYYRFLTTFSIGPSYLFLLRARVMEEGTEKKVSATTGFITGQLMMFISIYYAPLHLALGRPHTITVLALPYLLFHFFWNNHKHFFYYGSTTRNSMRNLSIQCVFLNNLIFQLFNHFILLSSMLVRLVNISMFRCNNKMLFVTSSFVGWLIGHILFMKWVGLILVWIQQNNSIRSNKYLVSEFRNSMARIFSILLFITYVYYLDAQDFTTQAALYTHHQYIAGFIMTGAFAHGAIFFIRDYNPEQNEDNVLARMLDHKEAIISHLSWASLFLGFHTLGLYVHNDVMLAFGTPEKQILIEPIFAQWIQSAHGKTSYGFDVLLSSTSGPAFNTGRSIWLPKKYPLKNVPL